MKARKRRRDGDDPSPDKVERLAAEELHRLGREWDRELVQKLSRPIGEGHHEDRGERKIA
ncbi:MAG TPA: hypothetical protein VKA30_10760 [Actinomycetota bacterium]|nr:hypothetical protein [Actinomycetota bacterium]